MFFVILVNQSFDQVCCCLQLQSESENSGSVDNVDSL